MKNAWILDVLTDLKTFAKANGLKHLSEQLEDTSLVAAAELANQDQGVGPEGDKRSRRPGEDHGGIGTNL